MCKEKKNRIRVLACLYACMVDLLTCALFIILGEQKVSAVVSSICLFLFVVVPCVVCV